MKKMKKACAIALAAMMAASVATTVTVASAAENETVLTTTVPAATYTLNIPADQEVPFGTTKAKIGELSVSDASGFAVGKNLKVTMDYEAFTCPDVSTTIPFEIELRYVNDNVASHPFTFWGKKNGGVTAGACSETGKDGDYFANDLYFVANSEDWGKALAGEYSATITFTAEVVAEE